MKADILNSKSEVKPETTTGCKRRIRKTFEVKIWKEALLVETKMIPQLKALDLSFNLAP